MSDIIEDLSRNFAENIWDGHTRSMGLFPIPEYPELEERGMWSTVLNIFLTTLRYLAPATLLTLFLGQPNFLFKLLKYIDSTFRTVVFSSEEQKQEVLQWLSDAGPVRVDKLDVVWRQGWIICGVLDTALPGACAGHPPSRLSVKHAQTIAEHYLGVEPVFTNQELESYDTLSKHQEWKLIMFLDSIRLSLSKLTPPYVKQTTETNSRHLSKPIQNTLDYIARGSGLAAVQINNRVYFKIYPTAQQSIEPGEITISIHGPRGAYGGTVLPPILGKAQLIRQSLIGMQSKSNFTENALPITLGTTYMRTYGKNDINKSFFIPKSRNDIEIEVEVKQDHARVSYIARLEGKYEISITSKGQNIIGSPFKATASYNIIKILEKDNFCLEDGEEINIVDIKTDRKVILRIVDYGKEKMLLKENGALEKISDDEAKMLLLSNKKRFCNSNKSSIPNETTKTFKQHNQVLKKFRSIVHKVLIINRACKALYDLKEEKILTKKITLSRTKQDIPDIVNSTFYDEELNQTLPEKKQRIIIPDSISVSILTEKPKIYVDEIKIVEASNTNIHLARDTLENLKKFKDDLFDDDSVSVVTSQSTSNPFLSDVYDQNYTVGRKYVSFIPNEFETNNSQSEETEKSVVKLLGNIHHEGKQLNPFLDLKNEHLEGTKLPFYLKQDDNDYCYDDSENDNTLNEMIYGNLKNNPFIENKKNFSQKHKDRPDFIIGAPVSVPPVIFSSSNENKTKSIEIAVKECEDKLKDFQNECIKDSFMPLTNIDQDSASKNSNYDSLDSSNSSKITLLETSREMSPKTDIWDSAYVSIDENTYAESTLSDSSNEKPSYDKIHVQSRNNLRDITYIDEDHVIQKYEKKRTEITPIIEENEKSISFGMRDEIAATESVMTAFAELDGIYDDIFSNSEVSSETTTQDYKLQNLGIDYVTEKDEVCVNSASDIVTDVKRQTKQKEEKISEVQANVTESVSVSQNLHVKENYCEENNNRINNETQFGDQIFVNIVSEQKKYWDEKIRQIEAKSEEIKTFKSKRRLSCKHLRRNDSLSKRRGKKLLQNFLNAGQEECHKYSKNRSDSISDDIEHIEIYDSEDIDHIKNEKLTCFRKNTSQVKKHSVIDTLKQIKVSSEDLVDIGTVSEDHNTDSNLKQELSEKVFQAFETSPKRFFGTSRKHILNKIDTFLGLPINEQETKKIITDVNHENGLVSSRISLFHNISNTEELPWARRKSKSMFNITYGDTTLKMQNEPKPLSLKITKDGEDFKSKVIGITDTDIDADTDTSTNKVIFQEHHQTFKANQDKMPNDIYTINFNETMSGSKNKNLDNTKSTNFVRKTIKDLNIQTSQSKVISSVNKLKSISKSEMDIFSRISNTVKDDGLDKHKSYEELPKISVKNFISHYEDVTKSSHQTRKTYKLNSVDSSTKSQVQDSYSGTSQRTNTLSTKVSRSYISHCTYVNEDEKKAMINDEHFITLNGSEPEGRKHQTINNTTNFENLEINCKNSEHTSKAHEVVNQETDNTILYYSDIEVEIIENEIDKLVEPAPKPEAEEAHLEYKNRFTMARKYFQSLEELRQDVRKNITKKKSDRSTSIESLEDNSYPKRRSNIKKSRSMPSSEIAKIWNEMQEQKKTENTTKLVKISEKFHVEDLFEDVMEGRLSRQGSLRGIPHKKAVLETFRSMENVPGNQLTSYEMAEKQLNDVEDKNHVRNAQTYLSEYPYLPTTDPSKYHSRLDTSASGLITFRELKKIPRRNSVPDLRLNPTFTADL